MSSELKYTLLKSCKSILEEKMLISKNAMEEAQKSANNEEKSTAGDKYDTARAMAHQNRDMNARQLSEIIETLKMLNAIELSKKHVKIQAGSLVVTTHGSYFLAVGIGKVTIENGDFFVISLLAPIAQLLLNKKVGDVIKFSGKEIIIEDVL